MDVPTYHGCPDWTGCSMCPLEQVVAVCELQELWLRVEPLRVAHEADRRLHVAQTALRVLQSIFQSGQILADSKSKMVPES